MAREEIIAMIHKDWEERLLSTFGYAIDELAQDLRVLDIYRAPSDLHALLRLLQKATREVVEDARPAMSAVRPALATAGSGAETPPAHVTERTSPAEAPSGIDLALAVLRERPERDFDVQEILDLLLDAGWSTDSQDARNAVGTLMSKVLRRHPDKVERAGWGRYRWTGPTAKLTLRGREDQPADEEEVSWQEANDESTAR